MNTVCSQEQQHTSNRWQCRLLPHTAPACAAAAAGLQHQRGLHIMPAEATVADTPGTFAAACALWTASVQPGTITIWPQLWPIQASWLTILSTNSTRHSCTWLQLRSMTHTWKPLICLLRCQHLMWQLLVVCCCPRCTEQWLPDVHTARLPVQLLQGRQYKQCSTCSTSQAVQYRQYNTFVSWHYRSTLIFHARSSTSCCAVPQNTAHTNVMLLPSATSACLPAALALAASATPSSDQLS